MAVGATGSGSGSIDLNRERSVNFVQEGRALWLILWEGSLRTMATDAINLNELARHCLHLMIFVNEWISKFYDQYPVILCENPNL